VKKKSTENEKGKKKIEKKERKKRPDQVGSTRPAHTREQGGGGRRPPAVGQLHIHHLAPQARAMSEQEAPVEPPHQVSPSRPGLAQATPPDGGEGKGEAEGRGQLIGHPSTADGAALERVELEGGRGEGRRH
jgi:hypothetical protein